MSEENKDKKVSKWMKANKDILLKVGASVGIIFLLGASTTILSGGEKKYNKWLNDVSDDDLSNVYEVLRHNWMSTGYGGNGEKTPEMKTICIEMSKRMSKKCENNPLRNRNPYFRWTDVNRWDKD